MWSDTVSAVLSGTGIATLVGAVAVFVRTIRITRQQGQIVEADVIERLSGTVGNFAEDVRRDALRQIEWATHRAEDAERRAVSAERAATEAQISSMQSAATVRRLTNAILSPYATIEGLRSMVAPEGPIVNGRG